jgi:pyrimidine-nucleoside phosphorylase
MRAVDIIIKKRDKQELTSQEIEFFIQGFTNGDIPDYQASAFAMAIMLNGMTSHETKDLTLAMAHSGQVLDLSKIVDIAIDKHSSGGVGDKTSISVMPMVAACGLPVGKMSGRGLGFSGGTLDKLEFNHRRIQETTKRKRHCAHRSIFGSRACGWQNVCAPRCDRHSAVDSINCIFHHVQEDRRRGNRNCAGC